ncbi:(2Fe-2S)-binding protein [Bosea sp. WAO]|uniref:(2Fe-2S)-binding protein n=1 Tax=Bosea sp. WAO TaxID=406341 RepID=UPI000746E859|nr:2Fe-2S iron-sulfur cluster-binding protein [Bosea sp. WAO]KUL94792.1 (2Fe-2S)-binding protein [Bosea sp. WAO]
MRFELNGKAAKVPATLAGDRLLWVLRDHFLLNGPKYGCGVGVCGACTVHVDGLAERACLLTAADVAGRSVMTLEGLGSGPGGGLHPVQQAWIEAAVPQCGYCQNGQIMAAAALLNANASAPAAEITAAMDGVICRCGTQPRIAAAISLAQQMLRKPA